MNATYVGELIIREVPGININANQAPGQTVAQEPMKALYGITAGINSEIADGTGHYNALQAQAKRRFKGDSSVAVNYTYSRAINDYGDQSDGESGLFTAMAAPYWHLNRGVAGFDRTHNIQVFGNYLLPFGKGQAYLQNGPAGYILGGWSLSGSLSCESGTPFTITGSGGSLGPSASGSSQLADVLSKSNMILGGHDSAHPYFNTANFQDPAQTQLLASGSSCSTANAAVCRFGNAGLHSLRGPGLTNPSISVARIFAISDRFGMVFRAEAFNLTNTPQFSNPASGAGSISYSKTSPGVVSSLSGFGYISGVTGNSNRELRFSGRMSVSSVPVDDPDSSHGAIPVRRRPSAKVADPVLNALRPGYSNWLLFSAMVEAALSLMGSWWDPMRIDYAVRTMNIWYKGDGLYGDGPPFHWDYYNSFVIQPMLLNILDTIAKSSTAWESFRPAMMVRATLRGHSGTAHWPRCHVSPNRQVAGLSLRCVSFARRGSVAASPS